ncbi:MAG TPA: Crp/Fnr family transcriptional regulator [Candidatus Binataceae bacterium]|nr:Crp/Fnr family transcriptional regulator [Candidatus Binataceae bacterium]
MPTELVEEVVDRQPGISFDRGAMVFCEGTADGFIAFVMSGFVKVYCSVGDGRRTLVRLAVPGDIIGYQNYLDERDRCARLFEAQASSKCSIALFSRDRIMRALEKLPPRNLVQLIELMNTYWSQKLQWFATLLSLPFFDRLKLVMTDLSVRAGVKDSEGTLLIPILGHEDFAEMIGCSRPMVSRLMSDMIDARIITRRGKNYVLLPKWDFDCLQTVDRTSRNGGHGANARSASHENRSLAIPRSSGIAA